MYKRTLLYPESLSSSILCPSLSSRVSRLIRLKGFIALLFYFVALWNRIEEDVHMITAPLPTALRVRLPLSPFFSLLTYCV